MEETAFSLVDYSIYRKVKPWQNLTLIIFAACWMTIFLMLFIPNERVNSLIIFPFVVSGASLTIFLILTCILLYKKKIGQLIFLDTSCYLLIGPLRSEAPISTVSVKVNVSNDTLNESRDLKQIIKALPKWGNFVIATIDLIPYQFEFEPNEKLLSVLSKEKIIGYESPPLLCKTKDLFQNLFWMLWAAS